MLLPRLSSIRPMLLLACPASIASPGNEATFKRCCLACEDTLDTDTERVCPQCRTDLTAA